MKKIVFIRHGKAESASWDVDDFDRQLTPEGVYNTEQVSSKVSVSAPMTLSNVFMIRSDAKRAYQSSEIYKNRLNIADESCAISHQLYEDLTTNDFLDLIVKWVPSHKDTLLVVGHNPMLSMLSNQLAKDLDCWLSTANAICIEFNVCEWIDLSVRSGEPIFSLFP
ncbi:hypothetical protein K4L44_10640 [Halosquirtibacter laminarini]|uniref:Uncharacterized protein n=1 Tax=Halosquirtibacter laminarini TaxID=3374600 RepID=A0AC61NC11_9BACT|nr:hypothetical protein K4L44_10640 [Prolixibacteraceae bacterium]